MSAVPPAAEPWLLADLGGTNVRFALARTAEPAPLVMDSIRAFRVADFPWFADAARAYLAQVGARPRHGVIAAAGPVRGSEVQLTNHAWRISAPQLEQELGLDSIRLVNDFAAVSMCLPLLSGADVLALGPPVPVIRQRPGRQTFCVLGPGTGLGVSGLVVRDALVVGLETEGGHGSFAPTNEEEIAILRHLMARFGRVSDERLLCGSGLVNLHQALCAIHGAAPGAGGADALAPLPPEEITARAQRRSDPLCVRAVQCFCEMLGTVAGDLALTYGAWDGVYLAGGLLGPLAPWLAQGGFRQRFDGKGRFTQAMAEVPVALIIHPQPGLLGAAGIAVAAAGGSLLRPGADTGAH